MKNNTKNNLTLTTSDDTRPIRLISGHSVENDPSSRNSSGWAHSYRDPGLTADRKYTKCHIANFTTNLKTQPKNGHKWQSAIGGITHE